LNHNTNISGLYAGKSKIPLQGVHLHSQVSGSCQKVTVTQRFKNQETVDVEAVYVFPLEESAALCGFEARLKDRVVRGVVEEEEKAFELYDDAMAEGHGAFLLDQERPNIFTLSVGNLRPGEELEIAITYVAQLSLEGDAWRLMFPTTVAPRYTPVTTGEIGQPDAERVNPERRLTVPYGLTLEVEIESDAPLRSVSSPSHGIRVEMDGPSAKVNLSQESVALDRDFVLLIESREPHKPSLDVVREEDGSLVACVTFFPDVRELNEGQNEVHFLLDCSGSMMGSPMEEARRALMLCLRALQEGDTFNITVFGSSFRSLWPSPRTYTDETLEEATSYLHGVNANLGGTEILRPLRELLSRELDTSRLRQILLFTDGEVSNEHEVISLCKQHASQTRVFSFGIGAGCSEHLVRGVARASGAAAEFIAPGERMEPKVLRMFRRLRTPALTDIRVDWGGKKVEQAPAKIPPLFGGDSLTLFARKEHGAFEQVTLHAGEQQWTVLLDPARVRANKLLPTLWARHMLRDLEDGRSPRRGSNQNRGQEPQQDRQRTRLVELAKRYNLTSSATSFVAVHEREEHEKSQEQAELRHVPVQLTTDWGGNNRYTQQAVPTGGVRFPGMAAPPIPPPMPQAAVRRGGTAKKRSAAPSRAIQVDQEQVYGSLSPTPPPAPMPSIPLMSSPVAPSVSSRSEDAALFQESGSQKADIGALTGKGYTPAEPEPVTEVAQEWFGLLMKQKANGAFEDSPELRSWLEGWESVEALAAEYSLLIACTAFAVAVFRQKAADHEDEWFLAVDKAERWLEKQGFALDRLPVL
jgi:Ca-activated chloride channel family protein